MRKVFIFFLLACAGLLLHNSAAKSSDSINIDKTLSPNINLKQESTMDGVTLLAGAYLPFHNGTKGTYGKSFCMGIQYSLDMGRHLDIMTSIALTKDSGSPYYDVSTFSSNRSSKIRFVPMEVSLRRRIALTRDTSTGLVSRGLYFGIGINYISAREEIPDILLAKGGDFGMQIFAGPQIFFKDRFAFEPEVKLIMNNVRMKYQEESYIQDKDYILNLYGVIFKLALSWYY